MKCERCGSDRSYQFEAKEASHPRPGPQELPVVCRHCGLITIDGVAVNLPEALEEAARGMAEAQLTEVEKARTELQDSAADDRVDEFMSKFFKAAYLEGFFRAVAYFRHNARQGRLVRLREIWDRSSRSSRIRPGIPILESIQMSESDYNEFQVLLGVAYPEDLDAKNTQKQPAPRSKDSSQLS